MLFAFVSNVLLSRQAPRWPAPRGIATCLFPERRDECATNTRTGGHQPDDWQADVLFLPSAHRQALPVAPLRASVILPFCSPFEYVDALGAVIVMAQKEPMNADPTSHRVPLWRGESSSDPGGYDGEISLELAHKHEQCLLLCKESNDRGGKRTKCSRETLRWRRDCEMAWSSSRDAMESSPSW